MAKSAALPACERQKWQNGKGKLAEVLWSWLPGLGSGARTQHSTVWTLSVGLEVLVQWRVGSRYNMKSI